MVTGPTPVPMERVPFHDHEVLHEEEAQKSGTSMCLVCARVGGGCGGMWGGVDGGLCRKIINSAATKIAQIQLFMQEFKG